MPRFVILRHELPSHRSRESHWDLMFEQGDVLRTWAVQEIPPLDTWIDADLLPDHRVAYLDYEGPISGDRGTVSQWDAGTFEWLEETEAEIKIALSGKHLDCTARFRHPTANHGWRFVLNSK